MEMNTTEHKYTNQLIHEKSPYLLQHAHNPVNWYAWNEEAFQKAKEENKPIFLSIGYSTCHWCHVMERESFENEEVAAYLNQHFVSIKVDREERPDIDHIYMTVCQAMTGQGGWPLTIIMTPDKKPFFAGTYFPRVGRSGMSGLMDILPQVVQKWEENYEDIIASSEQITNAVKPSFSQFEAGAINETVLKDAYKQLEHHYDSIYGGFYGAPKFPTPHQYMFLLRYYKGSNESKALEMVEKSLSYMYRGGMYDHIGFGFARYSTDEKWLVPHFEKMLYDNALLAFTNLEAYQVTKNVKYAKVAEEIFTYVLRDMQDEGGGFYSAEDADSEGVEGKFYVWTPEEVIDVLGQVEGELFCEAYDITPQGNFEGKSIPNLIHQSLEELAKNKEMTMDELQRRLDKSRKILFEAREERIHPHKDDKILTSWNGLMIAALAKGAQVLGKEVYKEAADKAIQFILKEMRKENGRLLARYREGEAAYLSYLDDYAFFIWGLIEQYHASFDSNYIKVALELHKDLMELFWDDMNGGFYFYGKDAENLLARPKEIYDGAMPSGNSVAALNLLRLARMTGDSKIEDIADKQIKAFAGSVKKQPNAYTFMLTSAWFSIGPTKEIVISGVEGAEDTMSMLQLLQTNFLPEAVILLHTEQNKEIEEIAPYTKDQKSINEKATAYVCENFACQAPTTNIDRLEELIQ